MKKLTTSSKQFTHSNTQVKPSLPPQVIDGTLPPRCAFRDADMTDGTKFIMRSSRPRAPHVLQLSRSVCECMCACVSVQSMKFIQQASTLCKSLKPVRRVRLPSHIPFPFSSLDTRVPEWRDKHPPPLQAWRRNDGPPLSPLRSPPTSGVAAARVGHSGTWSSSAASAAYRWWH